MSDTPECMCGSDDVAICDNDCGTSVCMTCGAEWYVATGFEVGGHHPECGTSSDEISSDEDAFS